MEIRFFPNSTVALLRTQDQGGPRHNQWAQWQDLECPKIRMTSPSYSDMELELAPDGSFIQWGRTTIAPCPEEGCFDWGGSTAAAEYAAEQSCGSALAGFWGFSRSDFRMEMHFVPESKVVVFRYQTQGGNMQKEQAYWSGLDCPEILVYSASWPEMSLTVASNGSSVQWGKTAMQRCSDTGCF